MFIACWNEQSLWMLSQEKTNLHSFTFDSFNFEYFSWPLFVCLSESKRIVHKKQLADVQMSKHPTVLKGKSLNKKNVGWFFFLAS